MLSVAKIKWRRPQIIECVWNAGGVLLTGEKRRTCNETRLSATLPTTILTQTGQAGKEAPFSNYTRGLDMFSISEIYVCNYLYLLVSSHIILTFWHRNFTFNSNKSPTWYNSFQFIILTFVYSSTCFGRFPPIIRSSIIAVAASGFTFVSWWQSCCHCSHWAPDDGRENVRNMLSCKQTSA